MNFGGRGESAAANMPKENIESDQAARVRQGWRCLRAACGEDRSHGGAMAVVTDNAIAL
jgi:hypothetical protein